EHPDPHAGGEPAIEAAVVDEVALASVAVDPVAAQQTAAGIDHRNDAHPVAADVDGLGAAVRTAVQLGAGPLQEALGLVVADNGAAVLLDDEALARLLDDLALAPLLEALQPEFFHVVEAPEGGA